MSQTKAQLIDNLVQPITGAAGSASAPTFSFTSDPNSGLYSVGADQLALSTGGTGRLFIDANGTVRINSTIQATSDGGLNVEVTSDGSSSAPFTLLNRGTSNNTGVYLTFRGLSSASAETDYAYMQMIATNTSSRNGAITFWTADSGSLSEHLRIDSLGNIGIGTTTPVTFGKLAIEVPGTTTPTTADNVKGSSVNLYAATNGGSTDNTVGIFGWQANQPGIGSGIGFSRENTNDWGSQVRFYTHPPATSNISDITERMRITADGNVGIGQYSTDALTSRVSQAYQSLRINNANITAGASQYAYYGVNYYQDTNGTLRYIDDGYSARMEQWGDFISFNLSTGTADNAITGSELARFDSSGRFLVGTASGTNRGRLTVAYDVDSNNSIQESASLVLQNRNTALNGELAGGIFMDCYRDVSNPAYAGGIWFIRNQEFSNASSSTDIIFGTQSNGSTGLPAERMRIRSDGAILAGSSGDGIWHGSVFSRLTGNVNRGFVIVNTGGGIGPLPSEANGTTTDNNTIFGYTSARWSVIYAATGTINTSDINEKQDVQDLSAAELAVALELKTLLKTFRWKEAVQQKGNDARIHVGVMAQDVEAAFQKHGLDATRYALWCKDIWYEVEGKTTTDDGSFYTAESEGAVEKTRLGIRYDQLLAFVLAAL